MSSEIIIGFIGVIITIVGALYILHKDMKKDRVELEKRLTKIEEQLKTHNIFYTKIQDYMFQNIISQHETKQNNTKRDDKK